MRGSRAAEPFAISSADLPMVRTALDIERDLLKGLDRSDPEGCWIWRGDTNSNGYGRLSYSGKKRYVHRWMYVLFVGLIPDGMEVDHLCKNRACANPSHLEAVSRRENIMRSDWPAAQHARRTHCPRGHEYDRMTVSGRRCRACDVIAASVRAERPSAPPLADERTHCASGHEFTPENTYLREYRSNGAIRKACRACNAIGVRKTWKARKGGEDNGRP